MTDEFKGIEPAIHHSGIKVPYSWWAGDTASRFYIAIRDERKILGTRCKVCGKVFVPPRQTCPVCFVANEEWVELSDEGELISFTVARRKLAAMPFDPPVVYGLVKLDGADTALLHVVDVAPDRVAIGMRVKAKYAEDRNGGICDIEGFTPVS